MRSLLGRGLVASTRNGADRRTTSLQLLPPGMELLRVAPAPFTGVLPGALASLPPETLLRLNHDLGVLIGLLGADDDHAQRPLAQL